MNTVHAKLLFPIDTPHSPAPPIFSFWICPYLPKYGRYVLHQIIQLKYQLGDQSRSRINILRISYQKLTSCNVLFNKAFFCVLKAVSTSFTRLLDTMECPAFDTVVSRTMLQCLCTICDRTLVSSSWLETGFSSLGSKVCVLSRVTQCYLLFETEAFGFVQTGGAIKAGKGKN